MKAHLHLVLLSVILSGSALLSSCVLPPDTGYGGATYTSSYSSGYYDEPVFVETREVTYLPVGATYVYEYGEPHWYHNGVCYRRGSHGGYVIVEKRSSPHHSKPSHTVVERKYQTQPKPQQPVLNRENRYVRSDDHRDDSREGLIRKSGRYYKVGPHGQLILVK